VPRYEFRCRTCEQTFEVTRPMSESSTQACCPQGHADTRRLLSIAGMTGTAAAAPAAAARAGGGCCGGGCCG
jgi:putative FmdB family regulatory protein